MAIPGLRALEHVGLTVPDLDDAVRFFIDVIGCEYVFGEGPFAGYDLIPMKRWGEPAEQAAAIAFLASDDASFMTGQVIWVGT